jgi:hypothetical protein
MPAILGIGPTGIEQEWQQSIGLNLYNACSVDLGGSLVLGTGATITSGQTTQSTGYQLQAGVTVFTTVTPGVTGNGNTPTAAAVLPLTGGNLTGTAPKTFVGVELYVINLGANPINCYPNSGDSGNSINGQASNLPVVLGPGTITPFICWQAPGQWVTDGIGEGQAGSIATTTSQGSITAAGTNQATATPITQALANIATTPSGTGVVLPASKAGMQIFLANNGANTLTVYGNSSDTINGSATTTITSTSTLLFFCAVAGNWLTR